MVQRWNMGENFVQILVQLSLRVLGGDGGEGLRTQRMKGNDPEKQLNDGMRIEKT